MSVKVVATSVSTGTSAALAGNGMEREPVRSSIATKNVHFFILIHLISITHQVVVFMFIVAYQFKFVKCIKFF